MTFKSNTALRIKQFNTHLRDDIVYVYVMIIMQRILKFFQGNTFRSTIHRCEHPCAYDKNAFIYNYKNAHHATLFFIIFYTAVNIRPLRCFYRLKSRRWQSVQRYILYYKYTHTHTRLCAPTVDCSNRV